MIYIAINEVLKQKKNEVLVYKKYGKKLPITFKFNG